MPSFFEQALETYGLVLVSFTGGPDIAGMFPVLLELSLYNICAYQYRILFGGQKGIEIDIFRHFLLSFCSAAAVVFFMIA